MATVMWDAPFSLIPILDYTVTLIRGDRDSTIIATFTVSATVITINETHLVPFTDYRVGVVARNRAGSSQQGELAFTTEQAGMCYHGYTCNITYFIIIKFIAQLLHSTRCSAH